MRFTGGLPETACGRGSTLASTAHLRATLPPVLARLQVDVLLDAPCGDCNWISKVDLGSIRYIGVDASPEHVASACRNFPGAYLRCINILSARLLPLADAVLCRDFLQHLPNVSVLVALRALLTTGARWFLLTSHTAERNPDIVLGGFRPLDLTKPPVSFEVPAESIEDPPGSGRIIGVWPRTAIEAVL